MFRRLAVAFLLFAAPLHAQGTKDSSLVRANKADLDSIAKDKGAPAYSKRAQARIRMRDSLFLVRVITPAPAPTPVEPPKDTVVVKPAEPPKDSVVVVKPPTDTVPSQPPVITPPDGTVVTTVGPATVAELPRATVNTTYPSGLRQVRVPAGASLQAALDAALPGDELLLAPGATFTGNFTLPVKSGSGWIVVRTDATDAVLGAPGTRMTPTRAASAKLARIVTPNYTWALSTTTGTARWRFTGVEVTAAAGVPEVNMLVRLGDVQTTFADVPSFIVLDRDYIHGSSTLITARCVTLNSASTAVVDSWVSDCHNSDKDSQALWGANGQGPFLIQNNHLEGGKQAVFFGGASTSIANLTPSDITIIGNHLTRPMSWKGVWQTKTILEVKHGRRLLIEGNVIENVWPDGQVAFAILLKSEDQDCGSPWTQTADVTVRYNVIRNSASGINIAALQGACKAIAAARITVYDNSFEAFQFSDGSNGIPVQMLGTLSDAIVMHNSFASAGIDAMFFDGAPGVRSVVHSNVLPHGDYGVKGSNMGDGLTTIRFYMPAPSLFAGNLIVAASDCSVYPAGNLCPAVLPSTLPLGWDGRAVGADMVKVQAATKNAIVAP